MKSVSITLRTCTGPPEILSTRSEYIVVRGEPFQMTCEATGAPRLRVYWKKDNDTLYNDSSVTVRANNSLQFPIGSFYFVTRFHCSNILTLLCDRVAST